MAGRFVNPYPQFLDSTPTVRAGSKLFFYAAGTSTKLNTYTDRSLSVANTNPVVLNSAGYPSTEIWLQDLDYKVVLAPSTDTDPPTSPIWSSDYVRARDSALIAKTLTGSGSPNGSVAGTAGSASILPDFYWDFSNAILYVCTTTGSTSTAVWTAVNAATAAAVVPPPQGYLTLTSGTPVITGDVSAATAVYYTPFVGNLVPIYNGSSFIPTTFTEQTLTLSSSHVASNIYDVCMFNNSGVVTIVTGPSWSAGTGGSITAGSCARGTGAGGTALSRLNGIWTNAVQITGRNGVTTYTINANLATYVGSIFIDGTNGQITCHRSYGQSRKWGVWNAFNRQPIYMKAGDGTASWSYQTATTRAANNSSANSLTIFCGLAEEVADTSYRQKFGASVGNNQVMTGQIGIGLNSTTTISGTDSYYQFTGNSVAGALGNVLKLSPATYIVSPSLGINTMSALENGGGGNVGTFYGTEANMVLDAKYRG